MEIRKHWRITPEIDFLNHGSFGATPTVVLQRQRELADQLESDPIEFLAPERSLLPKLEAVRIRIAKLLCVDAESLVFVRNATDGVNAVLHSFPFNDDDEVVITNHGYNACNNAVKYACRRSNTKVRIAEIPFDGVTEEVVLERVKSALNSKTRLLVIDHVTSPTALVFPVKRLIDLAHSSGARVLVDGAHAPGMLDVDLETLGADYYTGNHHKWWCGPKASGFLFVDSKWQYEVRPTVISHGMNQIPAGSSRFRAEFDWVGTYDPTPLLALPSALDFLDSLHPSGLAGLMDSNHRNALAARRILCESLTIDSVPPSSMIGSMAAVPLPLDNAEEAEQLRKDLRSQQFEVPVFEACGRQILRVSMQAYNSLGQVERLGQVLRDRFGKR